MANYIDIGGQPLYGTYGNYIEDNNTPGVTDVNFSSFFTGVLQYLRSDLGVTSSGGNVTGWADQSGNGKNVTPATGCTYIGATTAGLNGHAGIASDGSTHGGQCTLDLPAPGTTPFFLWSVWRLVGTAASAPSFLFVDNASLSSVFINQNTTDCYAYNTTAVGPVTAALNSWGRNEASFSNSASDYVKFGSQKVTAIASNGDPSASRGIFSRPDGTQKIPVELLTLVILNNIPNSTQLNNASAGVTAFYGPAVAV